MIVESGALNSLEKLEEILGRALNRQGKVFHYKRVDEMEEGVENV